MKVEIETSSYNDRRYGKPWIAKVTFNTSQGEFAFGEWVGSPGSRGILIIDVEPGDIIARGQKDHRKPRNSAPQYEIVKDGPYSEWPAVDKAAAYKHYKARVVV